MLIGKLLDQVSSYNYLGVSIDENLTFENFFKEKYGKVYSRVYQLSKMRKYMGHAPESQMPKCISGAEA